MAAARFTVDDHSAIITAPVIQPGMLAIAVVNATSIGFGDAEASNQRFRKLIEIGTEQILVALDLPTQCGYDSDHEMATEMRAASEAVHAADFLNMALNAMENAHDEWDKLKDRKS